jgi:hypothetical protein
MDTVGKEIIPSTAFKAEVDQRVIESVDLSLIFNQHSDATDAEKSVSQVEPDSVVFIEGYAERDGGAMHYEKALEYLAYLRLQKGKTDPEYIAIRDAILDDINMVITTPAQGYGDFSQHSLREIQLLLEKDCIIRNADYVYLESDSKNSNTELNKNNNAFRESEKDSEILPDLFGGENANVAKTIVSIYKYTEAATKKHYLRESYVEGLISYFFTELAPQFGNGKDLNTTTEGKLKAYVIYGSAHKKSLSYKLAKSNYSFDSTVVDNEELREWMIIPEDSTEFVKNLPRKVAFTALRALSDTSEYDEQISDLDKIYNRLNILNGDRDQTLRFLIQCIQIGQRASTNPEQADKWFNDLKREFLEEF